MSTSYNLTALPCRLPSIAPTKLCHMLYQAGPQGVAARLTALPLSMQDDDAQSVKVIVQYVNRSRLYFDSPFNLSLNDCYQMVLHPVGTITGGIRLLRHNNQGLGWRYIFIADSWIGEQHLHTLAQN
ncbi:hypothetical protein ABT56_00765 [Photobacterium aquae]|uniref:Uncharacterized protein n=1 Tax=Photobacterium aquae TaxID=1195763 RepID=A0A0J1K5H4_9GAMM|nr:hypothetical protein [Photobacterium aquae]KLV09642.1 hypothetical protein ABT56_00765 [Photobacterium aquae]